MPQHSDNSNGRARIARRNYLRSAVAVGGTLTGLVGRSAASPKGRGNSDDLIPVPAGHEVPPTQVEEVPKAGRDVRPEDIDRPDKTRSANNNNPNQVPSTNSSGNNHWLTSTWEKETGDGFGVMDGNFYVPSEPPTYVSNYVFFFFPALQSYGSSGGGDDYILQPVLAWNWGGSGQWEIAAWEGSGNTGFRHSPLVGVSPNDKLWGYIERPSSEPGKWYVQIVNTDANQYTDLNTADLNRDFTYAYTAHEANGEYDHGSCNALPGDCVMTNLTLESWGGTGINAAWNTNEDDYIQCSGVNVVVYSSSDIDHYTPN